MSNPTPEQRQCLEKTWLDANKRSLGYLAFELREKFELTDDELRAIVNRFWNDKKRDEPNHYAEVRRNAFGYTE